jgi:hypothetical protein
VPEPKIAARYVLDRATPPEIAEELARRLGAREGDVVVRFEDGTVGFAQHFDGQDAAKLTRLLWPASVDDARLPSRPPSGRRRGARHLKVEK